MASLVEENAAMMAELGINGATPAPQPTAVQQGQKAFRSTLQKTTGIEGENARLMQDLGLDKDIQDPSKPPDQPTKVLDIQKLQDAPYTPPAAPQEAGGASPATKPKGIQTNAIGLPVDPTQARKVDSFMGGMGLGIMRAGENVWNLFNSVDDYVAQKVNGPDAKGIMEPSSYFARLATTDDPVTKLGSAVGQYVLPFFTGGAVANGLSKAAGLATGAEFGAHMITSGAVAFGVNDPKGERFGAIVGKEFPALQNPLFQYLEAKPDDTEMEGRWKNAVDSLVPDIALAGVMKAVPGFLRVSRQMLGGASEVVPISKMTASRQTAELLMQQTGKVDSSNPTSLLRSSEMSVEEVSKNPIIQDSIKAIDAESQTGFVADVAKKVSELPVNPATIAGPQNKENFVIMQAAQDYVERLGGNEAMRARTTGPMTMEEIDQKGLDIIANTPEFVNLIKGYKPGDSVKPEQIRAVQIFANDIFEQMVKADERAIQSGTALDIGYRDQKMTEFATVAQALTGMSETAGRTLGVLSKSTEGLAAPDRFKAAIAAVESMGGINEGMLRVEQIRSIRSALKESAGIRMMDAIAKTGGKVADAVSYIGFNSMVSNPATAARNLVSGVAKNMLSVGNDLNTKILGLIPGMGSEVEMAAKIANARIGGYFGSLRESTAHALKTLEDGTMFTPTLYNLEQRVATPNEQLVEQADRGGALRSFYSHLLNSTQKGFDLLTTRLNRTQDSFTGVFAYRRQIYEDAMVEGTEAGLQGQQLEDLLKLRLTSPTREMHEKALNAAKEPTMALGYDQLFGPKGTVWQDRIGTPLEKLDSALQATRLGAIAVPFLKASANEVVQSLEYMPGLGLIAPRSLQALKNGGTARVEAISKQMVSMELLGLAYYTMHSTGISVTGDGPVDKATMKALRAVDPGYQPYSIKLPSGEYVSYQGSGIPGTLLKIMGNYQEIAAQLPPDQKDRLGMGMAAHFADIMLPDQLTRDLPNFFEALADLGPNGDGKAISKLLADTGSKLVPAGGLLRGIRRTMDPNQRETISQNSGWETFYNKIKDTLPGWSASLPPQRNIFGEVVAYPHGYGPDFASPFYTSKGDDKLGDELRRLGVYNTSVVEQPEGATPLEIRMPSRVLTMNISGMSGKIDLKPDQYDRLVQYSAGINIPSESLTNMAAIDSTNSTYEERQQMIKPYLSEPGKIKPLRQAIEEGLGQLDNQDFNTQLQKDEFKRTVVKSIISDYQKMGKSAMFLDVQNVAEMQRQMMERAKVLKGE